MVEQEELGFAILFPSGTKVWGTDAYSILQQLRGGWNPESLDDLKISFCRRSGIHDHEVLFNILLMSDEDFIMMLFDRGFWVVKRVPVSAVEKYAHNIADAV